MPIPMLSDYKQLSPAPRKFLLFSAFNVFSWFSLVGPILVLFGRYIEMPASWIGYLISAMPISMLLVVVAIPLVTRLGSKKIMILTWFFRSVVAGGIFLVPWALREHGQHAAWYMLLGSIVGFCLIRSAGVGGWFPWLHEVVPKEEQTKFFSTEMAIMQSCIVGATLLQAFVLRGEPTIYHFLSIYVLGVASGIISTFWLARVPGGGPTYSAESKISSFTSYAIALKDTPYLLYTVTTCACFSCLVFLNSSTVLYMRDGLDYSDMRIMIIMAGGNLAVLLTIHYWGRFADHSGAGYAALCAVIGHSIAALLFLVLKPGSGWTAWLLPPVLIMYTLLASAYWTLSHRYMMNLVDENHKVAYTNIWIVGTALSMGLTPIVTGYIIEHYQLSGFRGAFICSGVGGIVCGLLNYWVEHSKKPFKHSLNALVNPSLPVRTLANIAWVTVGKHESNKDAPKSSEDTTL